ncbi:MAG: hypothetical protein Q9160_003132 [Pyrenula sp. 1 TL-2023]
MDASAFHEATTHLQISTVKGFFLQDEDSTDPATFDYTTTNFGLIDQRYDSDDDRMQSLTPFKVVYMGRHGEGFHNVAQDFYGTEAWDCYWAKLNGNDTSTWFDAHLTSTGIAQAQVANSFWAREIQEQHIPTPQAYFVSPLHRCLETANVTFSGLDLPSDRPFAPTIKETPSSAVLSNALSQLLREALGIHTCDRRSPLHTIRALFPSYAIEPGFSDPDPLWVPDLRESNSARVVRMKKLLDDVFALTTPTLRPGERREANGEGEVEGTGGESTFISLSSHSGAISCILTAIGHRPFPLRTGAVIPVLVRVERVQGEEPTPSVEPWRPAPECTIDPTAKPIPAGR